MFYCVLIRSYLNLKYQNINFNSNTNVKIHSLNFKLATNNLSTLLKYYKLYLLCCPLQLLMFTQTTKH